ncbi:hypothetical protein Tco_1070585 [Tanacetum coccineum]|uniref:Uncharacterized protein n=1 Tax=Tanacetum coccineum TaxID=301880 RepID=A0ABQ5HNZ0_9ASTR
MSQDVILCVMNSTAVFGDSVNLEMKKSEYCNKCLDLEAELVKKKNMVELDVYTELSNRFARLEKHCISLELDIQLNQQIFQKTNHDTTINKLRNHIKSLREYVKKDRVKHEMDEIETINIELEHSVVKLLSENELLHKEIKHLKKIYKDQFDSIKNIRALFKEHCDSLITQLNSKSMENADLKGMFKLDIEPISHKLKNNRDAHEVYLEKTIENNDTLRGLVECARKQNPSESLLESACMFTKHVQELLVYVSKTCPSVTKPSEKLVVVTPMNKDKKVRFAKPVTSSSNIPKQTDFLKTIDSNKPLFPSTGVNTTTSVSESKPSGNTKKNRITRTPSSN